MSFQSVEKMGTSLKTSREILDYGKICSLHVGHLRLHN